MHTGQLSGKGETINSAHYIQALNKLHHTLCERHPKKKTVILLHDNVRPRTAHLTLQTIQNNSWELLSHPSYNPDLASSDYCVLGPLKDHLKGHHYETDKAVQEAVQSWL